MSEDLFYVNGVDGATGSYLLPPATPEAIFRCAQGSEPEPRDLDELRHWHELGTEKAFGPGEGLDPCELSQVGWGVIFAHGCDPAVREALRELLDHRRRQALAQGRNHYKEFWDDDAFRPGESKSQFLARHGAAPGPVDPERVPYYLLLVGSPREIPFAVQYQLDVQYAVGRLFFDTPDEYRRYAASVVSAETRGTSRERKLSFFAPQNPGDRATEISRRDLVEPLARRLAVDHADWSVEAVVAGVATKPRLLDLLTGKAAPALVFTAGHGLGWPVGHPAQPGRQGALVCQEWPGPADGQALSRDQYVCADDLSADARVHGLVAFHFACFGAGTPEWDDFAHRNGHSGRQRLAAEPMVSALPRHLLAHPGGGALAVAGHVDRAWGYSIAWPGAGRQTEVYRSCLERLLRGHPIGSAFDYVNLRYAELSSDLSTALEDVKYGRRPDYVSLSTMWTANNDARGFVVLGDPAIRLASQCPHPDSSGTESVTLRPLDLKRSPVDGQPAVEEPAPPDAQATASGSAGRPERSLEDARQRLVGAAENLAALLERVTQPLEVVEIATYSSEDPSTAVYDAGTRGFTGARLRFLARADLVGNVRILVGERATVMETEVWKLQLETISRAQENRRELMRDLGRTLGTLGDLLHALRDE